MALDTSSWPDPPRAVGPRYRPPMHATWGQPPGTTITSFIKLRGHEIVDGEGCRLCKCKRFDALTHDCPRARVELQTGKPWPEGGGPVYPKHGPVRRPR
jgi:hypothetical protein